MQDDQARDSYDRLTQDHRHVQAVEAARRDGREGAMRLMLEVAVTLPDGDVTRKCLLGIVEQLRLMSVSS